MIWKNVIQELIHKPHLHARFLNTLSLLEFIGARKIMKSQEEAQITPTVLAHATEEIRHAQIIKKLAIKVGGASVKSYAEESLMCGEVARDYIHGIDYKAQEVLGEKDSWRNYLLTTLIIEERAQELYPFYDQQLSQVGLGGPLQTIVREEVGHLEDVIEKLQVAGKVSVSMIDAVRNYEKRLFDHFFESVIEEMKNENPILDKDRVQMQP